MGTTSSQVEPDIQSSMKSPESEVIVDTVAQCAYTESPTKGLVKRDRSHRDSDFHGAPTETDMGSDQGRRKVNFPAARMKNRKSEDKGITRTKVQKAQRISSAASVAPTPPSSFPTRIPKSSPIALRSFRLEDLQAWATPVKETPGKESILPGNSAALIVNRSPRVDIEVPDSQLEDSSVRTEMQPSPPMTSSFAVPASPVKKKHPEVAEDVNNEVVDLAESAREGELSGEMRVGDDSDAAESTPAGLSQKRKRHRTKISQPSKLYPSSQTNGVSNEPSPLSASRSSQIIEPAERPLLNDDLQGRSDVPDIVMEPSQLSQTANAVNPDKEAELPSSATKPKGKLKTPRKKLPTHEQPATSSIAKHSTLVTKQPKQSPTNTQQSSERRHHHSASSSVDIFDAQEGNMDAADDMHDVASEGEAEQGPDPVIDQEPKSNNLSSSPTKRPGLIAKLKGTEPKPSRKKTAITKKRTPRSSTSRRESRLAASGYETVIERALDTVHNLSSPPDLPDTGDFTSDERELIRRAIVRYQKQHHLDNAGLVHVIQWTDDSKETSRRNSDYTPQEQLHASTYKDFWNTIKDLGLNRKMATIKSHVRGHYHSFKTGGWTEDEDEELRQLHDLHSGRWKRISLAKGDRSMKDCFNRWRDYLQYGENRKTSRWSPLEEEELIKALSVVMQRDEDARAEAGLPSLGEYQSSDIHWVQVCKEMNNVRSRLQCSTKWQKMKLRDPPVSVSYTERPRTARTGGIHDSTKNKKSDKRRRKSSEEGDEGLTPLEPKPKRHRARAKPDAPLQKKGNRKRKAKELSSFFVPDDPIDDSSGVDQASVHVSDTEPELDDRPAPPEYDDGRDLRQEQEVSGEHEPSVGGPDNSLVTPSHNNAAVMPSRTATPGVKNMRWGDKLDIIEAILLSKPLFESDVDWNAIATSMEHKWSVRTLKAALGELRELVGDAEDFQDTLFDILGYMQDNYSDQLHERYDPHADEGFEDDFGDSFAKVGDEPVGSSSKAQSERKKHARAGDVLTGSPAAKKAAKVSGKKRTLHSPFTTQDLITASDGAESGQEM